MYIKLPFRFIFIYYTRKVYIILNLGVLEDICQHIGIEFYQINEHIQKTPGAFTRLLLYYGYLAGCKQLRKKPRHTERRATVWANKITVTESAKLLLLMAELYGKFNKDDQGGDEKKN